MNINKVIRNILIISIGLSLAMFGYLLSIIGSDKNDYLIPAPNLVLFSVDTLRADHLEIYGYPRETAPNLSQLSKEGIVFDSAYTVSTHSAPAHAAMLTGLYPLQHGQVQNGLALPNNIETLAEHLTKQGYATGGFVSDIILGRESNLQQGFQSFGVDHINSGSPAHISQSWSARVWKRAQQWLSSWNQQLQVSKQAGKEYQRQPFFLWLHANHPHGNYNPPPGFRTLFMDGPSASLEEKLAQNNNDLDKLIRSALQNGDVDQDLIDWTLNLYDGEIRFVDSLLGQLIDYLKKMGEYQRTVIIFVSDHGEMFFEHAQPGQPRSAAHHAGLYFEPVLKIPLVIKPSVHFNGNRNQRVAGNVESLDIFNTAFELLGLRIPAKSQSRSLLPLMQKPESTAGRDITYFGEILFKNKCCGLRQQEWRLIRCESPGNASKYKLYNLAQDPRQNNDLYSKHPAKAKALELLLDKWIAEQKSAATQSLDNMSEEMRQVLEAGGYIKNKDS